MPCAMNVAGKVNSDANLLAGLLKEVPSSFTVTANKRGEMHASAQQSSETTTLSCAKFTNKQMAEIGKQVAENEVVATKLYCTSI